MPRLVTARFLGMVLASLFAASCGGGGGTGVTQLVINATAPPSGTMGVAYPAFTFTVASGGTAPFTWTETGPLPPGLSLSSTGLLSGTPTSSGPFPFTVTVTDSAPTPQTSSVPFAITINPPPPQIATINNVGYSTGPWAWSIALPAVVMGPPYPTATFGASYGLPPLVWSETGALPTGLEFSAGGVLSGTPERAGQFPITINLKDALNRSAPSVVVTVRIAIARPAAGFTQTAGSMTIARSGHTATLLLNGQVLIAGGPNASAELYDPATGKFSVTGSMTVARFGHTATLLGDKVLASYGYVLVTAGGSQTAELYDPATGTFAATGSMLVAHDGPTATLLQNGQVLIAGGGTASAELFNPATGTFTATGSMLLSLSGHTATLLPNGQVLIAGGATPAMLTAMAELYDPASGKFTATGPMSYWHGPGHTATLLADGTVLIVGAANEDFNISELFDPATGSFSLAGHILTVVYGSTASVRSDGSVIFAGGSAPFVWRAPGGNLESAPLSTSFTELFAPECEGFLITGSLVTARDGHTATVLADDSILIAGGVEHTVDHFLEHGTATPLASAELYK